MHINFVSYPENCRNPLQEQRVEVPAFGGFQPRKGEAQGSLLQEQKAQVPKRLRLRGAKRWGMENLWITMWITMWISKCIILPSAPSSAKIALISAFKCSKGEKIPTSTNRIKIVYIGKIPTFALFTLKKHGKFPTFCMLKLGKIPTFTKKRLLSSSAATADLLIKYLSSSSRSLTRIFPEIFRNPLQGQRMEVPAFGGFQPRKSQARLFYQFILGQGAKKSQASLPLRLFSRSLDFHILFKQHFGSKNSIQVSNPNFGGV